LIEIRLQGGLLGTLLLQISLGLGASVLDLLRLLGALILDVLLASVLLPSESDRDEREHDRDDEELQPVPSRLPPNSL
jgi:hypothetical protein